MDKGSYITDCWIEVRNDGERPIFGIDQDGNAVIRLAGYAIIPLEKYAEFFEGEKRTEMLALAELGKQFLEKLKAEVSGENITKVS